METDRKLVLIFFLISFLFVSCKKEEKIIKEEFNYKIYNESDLVGFEKLNTFRKSNSRIDSVYRYSKEMIIQDTTVSNYNINSLGISSKKGDYYLDISKDSCYQIIDKYDICYEGRKEILVEGKSYKNTYKFFVTEISQGSHSIKTVKYFDENFVLIKNEFIQGYRRYFRVDRVDRQGNAK